MKNPRPDDPQESLLPRDWAELGPLVDQVLDAAPKARSALIAELAAGDPARQRALEQLVAACERDLPLLNGGAAERFDALAREPEECLLPELIAERYRTGRELGRGGMARVYLARDTKHGRDVAIKVIRAELSASLGHDRFLREIGIAARLRHPNIVPLYDSGEVGGSLYFVMPYEEGRSLRDRLRDEGALPIADALSVLRDIARALAYAHEHGVVHRDVKPDNVMLSGDAAVVTDFGIAKALSAALGAGVAPTLTQAGSGIGTPAYMAPEQAMGDPATDHRADIYSFGCVAYELFTGKPPFPEPTSHQVMAAHMTRVPRPVTELRTEVPPSVADLITHCLAKLPADRPQQVRDVLGVLDGAATTGSGIRTMLPVAQSTLTRTLRWGSAAVLVALISAGAYLTNRASGAGAPITISVLPFGNIAADSSADYLTDGLAIEVAAALTRIPGIQIKSRSGASHYRGQLGVDVAEASTRLKAEYLMTGVVRQERGRWILSADVTRGSDAASIWAENFTIDPAQWAGAVDAIARSLITELRRRFPKAIGATPSVAVASQTRNPEAYRLYLRGQERLSRRGLTVKESAELFRQAIREDTLFARAYSGLSLSLALFPHFQRVPPRLVNDSVVSAAKRALALDPNLSQPHVALGLAHQFAYRWDSAEVEYQTAILRDARDIEARVQYARHLLFRGRNAEAMSHLRAARAEDPASALVLSWMSYGYYLDDHLDSALAESRRALENDSLNRTSTGLGALVLLANGLPAEARQVVDRVKGEGIPSYVVTLLGDPESTRRRLARLEAESPPRFGSLDAGAHLHLALSDTAKALDWLERATAAQEIWHTGFPMSDPMYDALRGSARFATLLQKVGLPASFATVPSRTRGR